MVGGPKYFSDFYRSVEFFARFRAPGGNSRHPIQFGRAPC
jgi:hypothetical protein